MGSCFRRSWGVPAVALAAVAGGGVPAAAQEPVPEEEAAGTHIVRSGDTLWDLAREYLDNPFRWPEIVRLNTGVVEDPHWIFPSEELRIPGGGGAERVATRERSPMVDTGEPERTVFFETAAPRQQARELQFARGVDVPAIPPGDFYRAGMLVEEEEVSPVGRITELLAPSVVPVDDAPLISLFDRVLILLDDPARVEPGEWLHFFRRQRRVKPFGWIYNSSGRGRVIALEGNTATVMVEELFDAVRLGDLAVPSEAFPLVAGQQPAPVTGGETGQVLAFLNPHPLQSIGDVAFIDLGKRSGLQVGDRLMAYLAPRPEGPLERPELPVATLEVVRVTERTATTRVTDLRLPALEVGMPVVRVAAIP